MTRAEACGSAKGERSMKTKRPGRGRGAEGWTQRLDVNGRFRFE